METTESAAPCAKLFTALAAVQADLPRVAKDASARIEAEGKKPFSYKYADLADVAEVIMPLLGKNGLAFTAKPTLVDGLFGLAYKLVHESGEFDEGFYLLPDPRSTAAQKVGSAITYARRYCLCAVTGVAPNGDDDDAAAVQADGGYQSAGAAFETASPVRPAARQAPAAARPESTDKAWLDAAITKAPGLDSDGCKALWRESAAKVHAGEIAKPDAKQLQDILRARIEELGREAKANTAAPEDPSTATETEEAA